MKRDNNNNEIQKKMKKIVKYKKYLREKEERTGSREPIYNNSRLVVSESTSSYNRFNLLGSLYENVHGVVYAWRNNC